MATASTSGNTIACSAEASMLLFRKAIDVQDTTRRVALEDSLGRFKLWAGNIGALHKGKSSLDARLGQSDITDEVLHLLDELEESLQYLVEPFDNENTQNEDDLDNEDYADLFDTIAMTITNLLKITALIRHNPDRDPWKRVLALPQWYTRPDVDNATMKFPKLESSPWLADRLGLANSRRRQYFRTREEHVAKLGQPLKDQGQLEEETAPTTYHGNQKAKFGVVQDTGSDVAPSDTDFATEFGTDYATKMSIPPPPPELGTKGAECTLCHNIIFIRRHAWKKHVYRDLRPYVCLFNDCGFQVFDRRRDRQAHDIYEHRASYACPLCSEMHNGKKDLSFHLSRAHSGHFAESEQEALLSSTSASRPVLTASMCPFCDQWNETQSRSVRALPDSGSRFHDRSPIVTEKAFARHVGQHMEQLSLFAIPKNYEEGEDASNVDSSPSPSSSESEVGDNPTLLSRVRKEIVEEVKRKEKERKEKDEEDRKRMIRDAEEEKQQKKKDRELFITEAPEDAKVEKRRKNEERERIIREARREAREDRKRIVREAEQEDRKRMIRDAEEGEQAKKTDRERMIKEAEEDAKEGKRKKKEERIIHEAEEEAKEQRRKEEAKEERRKEGEDFGIWELKEKEKLLAKEKKDKEDQEYLERVRRDIAKMTDEERQKYFERVESDMAKPGIITWKPVGDKIEYDKINKKPTLEGPSDKGKKREVSSESLNDAPVFPKIHRDDIDTETLRHYDIAWERSPEDLDYIVLLEELTTEDTHSLFEHTKKLRKQRRHKSSIEQRQGPSSDHPPFYRERASRRTRER